MLRWILVFISIFGLSIFSALVVAQTESVSKPKVIALAPHIVELLFEMGAGGQIIGTTEFADFPAAAKNIPVVGNYAGLQVERILGMQPDIIIAWKTGNPAAQLSRLEKLGLKVIYSHPLQLSDIPKEIRLFGQHTSNQNQAENVASQFEQRLAAIQAQIKNAKPLRVFYEMWPNPLTTVAQGSWNHNLLAVCGVENVFADASSPFPQVNIEQILTRKVEAIVQPLSKSDAKNGGYDWRKWQVIPAVQNKRIIRPNADKLHRMSSRVLDELQWLCRQLEF